MSVSYVGALSLSSNSPALDPFLFLLLFRYLLGIPLMISLSLLLTLQMIPIQHSAHSTSSSNIPIRIHRNTSCIVSIGNIVCCCCCCYLDVCNSLLNIPMPPFAIPNVSKFPSCVSLYLTAVTEGYMGLDPSYVITLEYWLCCVVCMCMSIVSICCSDVLGVL